MEALPIDAYIPKIVATLNEVGTLVLTAPPGAGKTTRIPRALLDAGVAANGEILVLEPRRLAARLAAGRVAEEMGESLGMTVGYSIRFENVGGPQTRIRFLTEAVITRRLAGNAALDGVSAVILDEFHERHIDTDIALALVRQARKIRPELKILVMSATVDAAPVAAYLENAPIIALDESRYDIAIKYEEKPDRRALHEKVRSAVLSIFRSGIEGDILVFLPGAAEIRRAAEALQITADSTGFTITVLHGDLPAAEQSRAITPTDKPKVILSTNVAESSLTIPGIAAVIDSGLCRVAGHSAWSGLPTLGTSKISKSSATQRAGRAGRTQAGVVVRLYSRADYNARPLQDTPEILRSDLAETALLIHGAGCRDLRKFDWFERPADSAIESAEGLLNQLGAVDVNGNLTATGKRMLALPMHPRLSRLMLEGEKLGIVEESLLAVALISERDIRLDTRAGISQKGEPRHVNAHRHSGRSDLMELLDRFREAETAGFKMEQIHTLNLDPGAIHTVRQAYRQSIRLFSGAAGARKITSGNLTEDEKEEALGMAVLTAFPDRVARRRRKGDRELLMAAGGTARLSPTSVVDEPMFIVAVDIEEKKHAVSIYPSGHPPCKAPGAWIRLASAIELEWLAEFLPEKIIETVELTWNETSKRVDELRRTMYGDISLEETVRPAPYSEATSRILTDAIFARGIEQLPGYESLVTVQNKLLLLAETFPEEDWPQTDAVEIRTGIQQLCQGCRSFAEIDALSITEILLCRLTERQRTRLARETPERVALSPKRSVRIHYESDRPPWIESRLQDFFGMKETPHICSGRVALTLHLLAPNQRAVQVTQDLAGFWTRHYPTIRRELMRRYPRHAWPTL